MKRHRIAIMLLPFVCNGCLSIAGRWAEGGYSTPRIVIYPGLHTAGAGIASEWWNPLLYLPVGIDLPFSLIYDTIQLPTDLSHPVGLQPPITQPTTLPADAGNTPVTR